MIKLFTSPSFTEVGYLKGLLEAQGIICRLANEYSGIAAGGLGIIDTWPELWLINDGDLSEATRVLSARETS